MNKYLSLITTKLLNRRAIHHCQKIQYKVEPYYSIADLPIRYCFSHACITTVVSRIAFVMSSAIDSDVIRRMQTEWTKKLMCEDYILLSCMGSLSYIRNEIMYVMSWPLISPPLQSIHYCLYNYMKKTHTNYACIMTHTCKSHGYCIIVDFQFQPPMID